MENVWIDLGSFRGDITRRFVKSALYTPDYQMHAFEPNPAFTDEWFDTYPPGVIVHRKAAWIENNTIPLFFNPRYRRSASASICKNKITGWLDMDQPTMVESLDFSAWLRDTFQPEDHIIIKANIEGAEYEVFGKMIADETINYVDRLYLCTHWRKIQMPKKQHDQFVRQLLHVNGLTLIANFYDFDLPQHHE